MRRDSCPRVPSWVLLSRRRESTDEAQHGGQAEVRGARVVCVRGLPRGALPILVSCRILILRGSEYVLSVS